MKNVFYDSVLYSFQNKELSLDQRRGILNIIPKKDKDIRYLKNWRPLSLLNTNYKIIAKVLASRMQRILHKIINNDQSGYIKGRYIGENIRKILEVISFMDEKKLSGILLQLDFEKAFDSMSWQFLFKTLEKFNFGPKFISFIKTIYNKPLCCVTNNGYHSEFF